MTVGELVIQLQSLPQDHKVYLATDEEGNSFHPLAETEESYFVDEGRYECNAIHPDDAEDGQDKAVVLWP